jgi:NhaA family Na+:H+ antiporter
MRPRALPRQALAFQESGRWTTASLRFVFDRFLLLPLGAAIALLWANTAGESYFTMSHRLSFAVNEIGMALFFGLMTQEIVEAMMPNGALHTWRRWGMAVAAAAGGTIGAAVAFLLYVQWHYESLLETAWPVACAIDAAAAYYVLKIIAPKTGVLPFVLLLAIVTDTFSAIVVGFHAAGTTSRSGGVMLMLLALAVAATLRAQRVRSFWPYLTVAGTLSWFACYAEGIHPALALVPIVPFLPHEPRRLDLFADPPQDDETHHYEHEWNVLVQMMLFVFGLVNAGVLLRGYGTGTWALLSAALVGRPTGILIGVAVALALGLKLPARVGWRQLLVVAFATSSGFTFALFFATGLFPIGPVLAEIKIGALSTVAGAALAFAAARALHVGRYARRR